MSKIAIEITELTKLYRIGVKEELPDTLTESLTSWLRSPLANYRRLRKLSHFDDAEVAADVLWALRDISFQVSTGEVVGVIGHNGAGKTTLLKILAGITRPSSGRAVIRGRVGSLLEVGTGFHPELTGRENIYLNGTILGMSKVEVDRKFDQIVDFSEVEAFIDTPVKRYSSGMRVRLAFSVAAHLEPEILLIDEVLAVGDHAFQQRCLGKMGSIAREGRTILFVSHNMAAVTSLCSRAVLLDHGRVHASGPVHEVIEKYLTPEDFDSRIPLADREDRSGSGRLRMTAVAIRDPQGQPVQSVVGGQGLQVAIDYRGDDRQPLQNVVAQVTFNDLFGRRLGTLLSRAAQPGFLTLPPSGTLLCSIPRLDLAAGIYPFDLWIKVDEVFADRILGAGQLHVAAGDFYGTGRLPPRRMGDFLIGHRWQLDETGSP